MARKRAANPKPRVVRSLHPQPDWLKAVAKDPSYDWARIFWARAAAQPGAWFDDALADLVVKSWPTWFCLTEDRFAGKPFRLNVWQAIVVRMIVGWKVPTEDVDPATGVLRIIFVRLFRRLLLWIARKNGKSEFLAALGLMLWAIDAVMRGQGFVFARKESQALIIFDKMKAMISYSKDLSEGTVPYKKSIFLKEALSSFELLSGSEDGTHGKSPTVILGDEMHEWRSLTIATNLRQGMATRLQPFEAYASTAGVRTAKGVGYQLWEESIGIRDGTIEDITTLVVIFAADPDADPFDEKSWAQPNPSLGLSPTFMHLRIEAGKAKGNPRAEAAFRRYHLNQWVDDVVRWLPISKWDACADKKDGWKRYPEQLRQRTGFVTLDVSSTRDVTVLYLTCPPTEDDPKWRVMARFWVPEETLEQRVKEDRVPYDRWAAMKDCTGRPLLETTPGDYVDQNYVKLAAIEMCEDFGVERAGFDPWAARKLVTDIVNEQANFDDDFWVEIRQGIQSLGEASRQFERLVFAGLYDHGGNPMLRWMAQNTVIRMDENMNFMPAKKRSAEKIDGIVCGVMGVGLANMGENDDVVSDDFEMKVWG